MPSHHRPSSSRLSTATTPAHIKSRQFSHLNSQLAQLQAHLADLDNHVRITAIQAEAMKRLGAQHASMYFLLPRDTAYGRFMAITRVIGEPADSEESVSRDT
jgi:DASH complex subunit Hsk3 like